jgi:hypothetical protein
MQDTELDSYCTRLPGQRDVIVVPQRNKRDFYTDGQSDAIIMLQEDKNVGVYLRGGKNYRFLYILSGQS